MTKPTLRDALQRGRNNFDLLRLIAAMSVVFGHAVRDDRLDVWSILSGNREYSGSIAVYVFFMLSGILISSSYLRSGSPFKFAALRFGRIYPGYAVCILLVSLIAGAFFGSMPFIEFWHSGSVQRFLIHNLTLFDNGVQLDLPGVFASSPAPNAVGYPWWTLPVEICCYVMVLALGVLGILRSPRATAIAACGLFLGFLLATRHAAGMPEGWRDIFSVMGSYSFYPVPFFMLGMVLHAYADRVRADGRIVALLFVVAFLLRATPAVLPLLYTAVAYGALWFSMTPRLHRFAPSHDYSFGLYIYGFFAQQIAQTFIPDPSHHKPILFLVTLPIALAFAAMSWHLIEKPANRLTRWIVSQKPAIEITGSAAP